jgi:hypothetical protein
MNGLLRILNRLQSRLGALRRREERERELAEELRFHLEMETEKNLRRGLPPEKARRRRLNLRGPGGGEGGMPRRPRGAPPRGPGPGRRLRPAQPAAEPRVHRGGSADAGPRDRRQHRDVLGRERRPAQAAALRGRRLDHGLAPVRPRGGDRGHGAVSARGGGLPQGDHEPRRGRRVPLDELHPPRGPRAPPGPDPGRVLELFRRPRSEAPAGPRLRAHGRGGGGGGGAAAQPRVLALAPRRRPLGRREAVRDERPRPHRDRRAAPAAPVSGRQRRLHAHRGLSLPLPRVALAGPAGADGRGLRPREGGRGGGAGPRPRSTPSRSGSVPPIPRPTRASPAIAPISCPCGRSWYVARGPPSWSSSGPWPSSS